jgi:hypothetical protein
MKSKRRNSFRLKVLSLFLASCLISEEVLASSWAIYNSLKTQDVGDAPISDIATDMVDLYTGDFNYSVPLLIVPGPNGEDVDLTAYYTGGIKMEQKAGMLGLGWSLNTGEISRDVIGAPDDYAGQIVRSASGNIVNPSPNVMKVIYGAFNYNKVNAISPYHWTLPGTKFYETDNLTINVGIDDKLSNPLRYSQIVSSLNYGQHYFARYCASPTAQFAMPAYDNYSVSGPNISGRLQPYLFSKKLNTYTFKHPSLYKGGGWNQNYPQNNKTQFYFDNSSYQPIDYVPDFVPDNRVKSAYYVKYYTNQEINTPSNLFNHNGDFVGFLDYRIVNSTIRRPTNTYDPNAIGGIEVTDPNGITYHYSLPVMTKKNIERSVLTTGRISVTSMGDYANSWKLTSITGPDYKDVNGNKVVDEGDTGYWVAYKYSLWADNFYDSNVLYNNTGLKRVSRERSPTEHTNYATSNGFNSNHTKAEIYYLDYIRTSTHTAYFIKDFRCDNHSSEFFKGLTKVNPSLKLNKIILLRNADKNLIENSAPWVTQGLSNRFYSTLLTNPKDQTLIHYYKYLSNKSNIDKASIKTIGFVQDYSLCKKYPYNINSNYGSITHLTSGTPHGLFSQINDSNIISANVNPALFSSANLSSSGKLTLKEIRTYEFGGVELFAPQKFDYRGSNVAKNPDYNSAKKDIWGYYKSDHDQNPLNSGYPTINSALDIDAWSMAKISLPSGAEIEIDLESDTYSEQGFKDSFKLNYKLTSAAVSPLYNGNFGSEVLKRPHYIFPISSLNCNAPGQQLNSAIPSNIQFEQSDKSHIASCLSSQGAFFGEFYAVPILKSCSQVVNSAFPVYEVPDYYLSVGGPPGNTNQLYPNMEPGGPHCQWPHTTYVGYDKTKAYGYAVVAANWMYGGGTRVKEIRIIDPTTGDTYKKKFEYWNGYCPNPPTPYMLGVSPNNAWHPLWSNMYNYIPYFNLSRVGYSVVTVKNENQLNEKNGQVQYIFRNDKFIDPPLSMKFTKGAMETYFPNTMCGTSGLALATSPESVVNNNNSLLKKPKVVKYYLEGILNDREYENLGLLNSVIYYNNDIVPKAIYTKKLIFNFRPITEAYDASQFVDYKREITKVSTYVCGNSPANYTCYGQCEDEERYYHEQKYINNRKFLSHIEETLDGITTTTSYSYDQFTTQLTGEVFSSPTDGKMSTNIVYAYDATGVTGASDFGSKVGNEARLNLLKETYKVSTIKGGTTSHGAGDYLVSEEVSTLFRKQNLTRIYNSLGFYDIDYSLSLASNLSFAMHSKKRLVGHEVQYNAIANPITDYRLNGNPTMFNINGSVLESVTSSGRYSANKLGYNNKFELSSISNAKYSSFGFTSFEDTITVAPGIIHFGGEFTSGNSRFESITIRPHTGKYVSKVNQQQSGPSILCRNFDPKRTYEAKVWVHKTSPSNSQLKISLVGISTSNSPINLSVSVSKNDPANFQVGDWILMKCQLTLPQNLYFPTVGNYSVDPTLRVWLENPSSTTIAYFDDLMFHPIDATISGNVYDEKTGRQIAILDQENFATLYNFDAAGRVTSVYKESKQYGIKKLSETHYNSCQSMKYIKANTNNNSINN